MPETPSKRHLTQLNHEIEQADAEAARLESERRTVAKDAARARRRLRYLWLARLLRRPTESFEFWPTLILIAGSGLVGVLAFIVTHLVFGSFLLALLMFLLGTTGAAVMVSALLYRPPEVLLESSLAEAEANRRLQDARLAEKNQRLTEVNERRQRLIDERRDQIASGKLQRAALLQRNWKAMRGNEWEDFLVEVCRTLGATVERTGRCGDQGCDLIVEFGEKRVAVQAKGFDGEYSVNHKAVQEAYAGMAYRGCNSCAVITNTRFRKSAKELAPSTRCTLIGVEEFPDFVLGKIEL